MSSRYRETVSKCFNVSHRSVDFKTLVIYVAIYFFAKDVQWLSSRFYECHKYGEAVRIAAFVMTNVAESTTISISYSLLMNAMLQ